MDLVGTRFEVRVGTLVSAPMLAAFRVPLARVAVPRHRIHRLRLPADHDVPALVRRLTERDIEIVEIRRCPAPPPRRAEDADAPRPPASRPTPPSPLGRVGAVVLPFRRRCRWDEGGAPGDPTG